MKLKTSPREEALGPAKELGLDSIHSQVKFLQGKVLTIVEASVVDKVQLKAIKDLINTTFSDQLQYIMQLCYPDTVMLTSDQAENVLDMDSIK